ncbi:MAG TPA: DUF6760 family protein [Actinocrinis sp.]|nr:DUF6760 family protein [Actinocrinis sp.]
MTYGTDQLFEEVSYVAYHFHWPFDQILDLEHPVRREFVRRIGAINTAINASAESSDEDGRSAEVVDVIASGASGQWW